MSAGSVPQPRASSVNDHANDRSTVLGNEKTWQAMICLGSWVEHGQPYQMTCDCQNENGNEPRHIDDQGFLQHWNVGMFPKQNPTFVMLVCLPFSNLSEVIYDPARP